MPPRSPPRSLRGLHSSMPPSPPQHSYGLSTSRKLPDPSTLHHSPIERQSGAMSELSADSPVRGQSLFGSRDSPSSTLHSRQTQAAHGTPPSRPTDSDSRRVLKQQPSFETASARKPWLAGFVGAHNTPVDCPPGKAVRPLGSPPLPRPPEKSPFSLPQSDKAQRLLGSPSPPFHCAGSATRPLSDPPAAAVATRRLGALPPPPASSPGSKYSQPHSPPDRARRIPGPPALRGPDQFQSGALPANYSARKDILATAASSHPTEWPTGRVPGSSGSSPGPPATAAAAAVLQPIRPLPCAYAPELPTSPQHADYESICTAFGALWKEDECLPSKVLRRYEEYYNATFYSAFLPEYQTIVDFNAEFFLSIRHVNPSLHVSIRYCCGCAEGLR